MDGNKLNLVDVVFDKEHFVLSLSFNICVVIVLVVLFFLIRFLIRRFKKDDVVEEKIVPVKLKYKLGGAEVEYNIVRNYQNIEIAHRIYIELITRKAGIEIEEDKDVIIEIYNSWYALFQKTREGLKSINGQLLKDNNTSQELVRLLTDILNKGLRPHLTQYQAKFRKWYNEQLELDKNQGKSPQEIQKGFSEYDNLIKSMKDVNRILINYLEQLKKVITIDNK